MENLGFEILHILDLPIHILSEILIKLPAVSIVRCGSVCTKLRSIVSDSSFQQSYLSRAPISCVVLSDHHHLSCIGFSSSQTETIPSNHSSSCMAAMQLPPPPPPPSKHQRRTSNNTPINELRWNFPSINNSTSSRRLTARRSRFVTFHTHKRMNLVNSSHGLLCLRSGTINYHRHHHHHRAAAAASNNTNHHFFSLYYICNPLLGEILSVPPAPTASSTTADDDNFCFSAFGFDPKNNHYKILQLVWKSDLKQVVAELYRLGDRDWSSTVIDITGFGNNHLKPKAAANSSFDPSINGALHWVTDTTNINRPSQFICSFDLHTNKFKWVEPPPHFDFDDNNRNNKYYVNKISGISVGVLKGCLCLCYVSEGGRFETWSMDKYGVKESWRNVFSIDIKTYCGLRPQDKHRPIGFNSCGDMWLKADSDSHAHSQCLVSFTAETGVFRHIDIGAVASTIQATPQVLSYVSLKDMLNLPAATPLKLQTLRTDKNYAFGLNVLHPI